VLVEAADDGAQIRAMGSFAALANVDAPVSQGL
jgi:hypothetical protein